MSPDMQKYKKMLRPLGLTDAKQEELIHCLWEATRSFVDRAWNNDPVQQALQARQAKRAIADEKVINLKDEFDGTQTIETNFKRIK